METRWLRYIRGRRLYRDEQAPPPPFDVDKADSAHPRRVSSIQGPITTNSISMASPPKRTSPIDAEKAPSISELENLDLDQVGEREGYVLDARLAHADTRHLKTTKDGSVILIPQPSDDPNDPLNWSQLKKMVILIVISCTGTFLTFFHAGVAASNCLNSFPARLWICDRGCDTVAASCVSGFLFEALFEAL